MSGIIPLPHLCVFMVCTGTALPFLCLKSSVFYILYLIEIWCSTCRLLSWKRGNAHLLCVTVTDYIGTHGPCTTAGQCTCSISPMYGFFLRILLFIMRDTESIS